MRRALLILVALSAVPRFAWAQGDPLGPEFRVNTYTTDNQQYPEVAADSDGDFVVVWTSVGQDGSIHGNFGQRYEGSGLPLGPEFRVNTYTTNAQNQPSVAFGASGAFVVVWTSGVGQDGSSAGVFGQRYASSGAPLGPEFQVNTFTPGPQYNPAVASDTSGNFVVVWTSIDQDGSIDGVFGQRYASSGTPVGPEFRVNTYTTSDQYRQDVASDSAGNFVVVWISSTQDGSSLGVFGQRFDSSGTPLGPEFRVNTHTPNQQNVPLVATDPLGNFVVAWQSNYQDGSNYGVFGQRYASSGVPLGNEFRVNTYVTSSQFGPSVAADSSGSFVIVWRSYTQDGSDVGVFGQRFASSGAPVGPEFRVNTYTTSTQSHPAVAADPSGNFVVTWDSQLQDGSGRGVFGQRFGRIVPVELMRFGVE